MRALVLSNMLPDAAHPGRGRFVRDQVDALRRIDGLEVELHEFAPGPRALSRAPFELRRHYAASRPTGAGAREPGSARRFDVVHAHFGLTAWPALAVPARVRALTVHGSDLRRGRSRMLTAAALPSVNILAAVSAALIAELPGRRARRRAQVLPCGVDMERFRPMPRADARARLGLEGERPLLLFPADPGRAEKRHDRALALSESVGARLEALGGVDPELVPLWVNASNAVLVPSDREGFGLAVLEALACEVPVLATPVGVHPEALGPVAGTLCAPFELSSWRAALEPHLGPDESRVEGRASASRFSARAMALRVADAWRSALRGSG